MCGIAGLIGATRPNAQDRVRQASLRLRHRGPDGEGWYERDEAVLAMRRLAIIDLQGGDQPIYNEDRTVAVMCNGELYNYIEESQALRRRGHRLQSASDVNLIPHLYEEVGRDAFKAIRGMFAAAIWDATRRILVLARDRAGKKPLFYTRVGQGLAFASELPALLALVDTPPPYSRAALADYLRLGFVPHPETIYEGVFALPPGSTLAFTPGGTPDVAPYWAPPMPTPFVGTRSEALAALDAHLRDAVSLRLRSDVPVGMFLSGGIDSGLVAAYARDLGARDLLCFVAEVPDVDLNEGPAARLVAQHLGLPIETIPLTLAPLEAIERVPFLYGQPFGDFSAIPTYLVSRAASAHRKVVLNGDGGDEIMAGYRRYWLGKAAPWLVPLTTSIRGLLNAVGRRLGRAAQRRSGLGFTARALRGLGTRREDERYLTWNADLLSDADVERCFPDLATQGPTLPRLEQLRGEPVSCSDLKSFMRSDYRLIMADGFLSKMDMATMANSLEARSPFLDVPLAEFAWSLPARWLMSATRTKPMLRDLARAKLPPTIASAPKRGFEVPMGRWLKDDLRDVTADVLLSADSHVGALGDRAAVRSLVTGQDHFPGNHDRVVWGLLMLELFLRAPAPRPAGD
jgi:asparagine synthase (glutamine-hydrolysing)